MWAGWCVGFVLGISLVCGSIFLYRFEPMLDVFSTSVGAVWFLSLLSLSQCEFRSFPSQLPNLSATIRAGVAPGGVGDILV